MLAWTGDHQRESASGFVLFGPDTDGGVDAIEVTVGGPPLGLRALNVSRLR